MTCSFVYFDPVKRNRSSSARKLGFSASKSFPWTYVTLNNRGRVVVVRAYHTHACKFLGGSTVYEAGAITIRSNILRLKTNTNWQCSKIWIWKQNFPQALWNCPFRPFGGQYMRPFLAQRYLPCNNFLYVKRFAADYVYYNTDTGKHACNFRSIRTFCL